MIGLNKVTNKGNGTLWVVKGLMSLYIIHNYALTDIGFFIPRLSITLLLVSLFLTVSNPRLRLPLKNGKVLLCSFIFIVYCFMVGMLVAKDTVIVTREVMRYMESLVAGYIIISLIYYDKSIDFMAFSLTITALLVSRFMIGYSETIIVTGRVSVNEDVNANTVAVLLTWGVWSLGWLTSRIKRVSISFFIMMAGTFFIVYAELLTGSRKGIVSVGFILLAWLIINFGDKVRKMKLANKVLVISVAASALFWLWSQYGMGLIERSALTIERMENLDADMGEGGWKWGMIIDALRVWSEHPLFGVGFDNNRYYSIYGAYAHNTYAEVFASTGLCGALILGYMFFYVVRWHFFAYKHNHKMPFAKDEIYYACILLLVFLFICFNQICFYNERLMLIFNTIIGYSMLFENGTKGSIKRSYC